MQTNVIVSAALGIFLGEAILELGKLAYHKWRGPYAWKVSEYSFAPGGDSPRLPKIPFSKPTGKRKPHINDDAAAYLKEREKL
jgi:hypothetical protein